MLLILIFNVLITVSRTRTRSNYLRPQPNLDLPERLVGLHSEDQGVGGGLAAGVGAHHYGRLWDSFIEHIIQLLYNL